MSSRSLLPVNIILLLFTCSAFADDASSRLEFNAALSMEKSGRFLEAGDKYMAAELFADDPVLKLNALKRAAMAYKLANYRYREYQCLHKMFVCYPASIDFRTIIQREYEIGSDFYRGHRDPALTWMPWIEDDDRAVEIFEQLLKDAPFASFAPELRLRLAHRYIEDKKIEEAVKMFRTVSALHPNTKEARFADFEIANIYLQKSRRGDGDGRNGMKAVENLRELKKKYPNDPESEWIRQSLDEADQSAAKRLYGLAKFYRRMDNNEASARYLNELLRQYPDTSYAPDSETMLADMDEEYKPAITEYKEPDPVTYLVQPMPDEVDKIIVAPENSDGKWLLPIKDLGLGDKKEKDKAKVREMEEQRDKQVKEERKKEIDQERLDEK